MSEPASLERAVRRTGAPLCVGIDPVRNRLPAGDDLQVIRDFGLRIVDQLAHLVPAVKIQSACYERFGPDGMAVRDQLALHASQAGLIVVLDAKRGDIGVSSEHYAASAFSRPNAPADWVTISPYLGGDGMQPFLEQGAAFALVRTSNPGGTALQTLPLEDGRTVAHAVADMVRELGEAFLDTGSQWSRLGAVVGATHAAEIAEFRARMPKQWFLMPGVGAQGGNASDVAEAFVDGMGVLVNASRSIIYAKDPVEAAQELIESLREVASS